MFVIAFSLTKDFPILDLILRDLRLGWAGPVFGLGLVNCTFVVIDLYYVLLRLQI